ncbi:hypothetical protein GQ53DRAFT_743710 [Thozetella sp. PMI_491]|nr:hypothetical protein GQ53DRAFT_743710 [Thozetella sp. PMI_491]
MESHENSTPHGYSQKNNLAELYFVSQQVPPGMLILLTVLVLLIIVTLANLNATMSHMRSSFQCFHWGNPFVLPASRHLTRASTCSGILPILWRSEKPLVC